MSGTGETPNPRHQISNKLQKTNDGFRHFGPWSFEFGIFLEFEYFDLRFYSP
jgi:hypothetical protein